jgi:excisionase family DNA binding protein
MIRVNGKWEPLADVERRLRADGPAGIVDDLIHAARGEGAGCAARPRRCALATSGPRSRPPRWKPRSGKVPEPVEEAAWLTIGEVAALLQVSTRTVQRLTSPAAGKDRLLAARFGNTTRIRRAALEKWRAARERHA